jgi:hypothetical protein
VRDARRQQRWRPGGLALELLLHADLIGHIVEVMTVPFPRRLRRRAAGMMLTMMPAAPSVSRYR